MNLKVLALHAAVLKVLADEIETRLTIVKQAAKEAFDLLGATQAPADLPDGTRVANLSLSGGTSKSAFVHNDREFLEWVKASHPEEIVEVVRDNARKKILDACKAAGAPVDPATGEVIPGVSVRDSAPFVSLRFKAGGRDSVVRAWQEGHLKEVELLAPRELEAGEER